MARPTELGGFSLRLPKPPKLPDLGRSASFPPASEARTAWERQALHVILVTPPHHIAWRH